MPIPPAGASEPTELKEDKSNGTSSLSAEDVIQISEEFSVKRRYDLHRTNILGKSMHIVRQMTNLLSSISMEPSHSRETTSSEENLAALEQQVCSLQYGAFASRCIASSEAEVFFRYTKKHRPVEEKGVKRGRIGRKERKEKEIITPIIRPDRFNKDKASTSKGMDDTPVDTPIAINRGKRRAANVSITPVMEKPEKKARKENGSVKKRQSTRLSKTSRVLAKEEDEPTYCFCRGISFGDMIGCDNDKCEIEWFHFECIGLTTKPKGKWFCPNCRHPESARLPKTKKEDRRDI